MAIDPGVTAAIGAATLFGLSTPLAKTLVGDMPPLLLAGLLYMGSGLGLTALLLGRLLAGGRSSITWPRGTDLWWLLGAILSGGVLGPYLLMAGLLVTDSASATLILNLEGVLTALLAWFVFQENFDRRIAVGMALIVAGGAVLSLGRAHGAGSLLGPLAIAGACLAWAVDNNLTRKVAVHDAMLIACTKGLTAGITSVTLAFALGAQLPPTASALRAGLLGFVGYGLSLTLYVAALRHLGTARTSAYFSLGPFIGAGVAVLLGAPPTMTLLIAGLLMGAGVWLHLSEHHAHWHRHAPVEHEHWHSHDEHHQHPHASKWDLTKPHSHAHAHEALEHSHAHYPDIHHRHGH